MAASVRPLGSSTARCSGARTGLISWRMRLRPDGGRSPRRAEHAALQIEIQPDRFGRRRPGLAGEHIAAFDVAFLTVPGSRPSYTSPLRSWAMQVPQCPSVQELGASMPAASAASSRVCPGAMGTSRSSPSSVSRKLSAMLVGRRGRGLSRSSRPHRVVRRDETLGQDRGVRAEQVGQRLLGHVHQRVGTADVTVGRLPSLGRRRCNVGGGHEPAARHRTSAGR